MKLDTKIMHLEKGNTPSKHHYIPEFYLKKWCEGDRLIVWKSHPRVGVTYRYSSPGGTGYKLNLYTFPALEEYRDHIEDKFLKMVDSKSAQYLNNLIVNRFDDTSKQRSHWSTFLLSMMIRNPESIHLLKKELSNIWDKPDENIEEIYRKVRNDTRDPEHVGEYLKNQSDFEKEKFIAESIMHFMSNERIGHFLNKMPRSVLSMGENCPKLLTSDRAIISTNGLDQPNGHLAIPLSPRHLFVACKEESLLREIISTNRKEIAKSSNRQIVRSARSLVFSSDLNQKDFIIKHFSKEPGISLGESTVRTHGQRSAFR